MTGAALPGHTRGFRRPGLLADLRQLGPRGVEVTLGALGALGAAAQLPARLGIGGDLASRASADRRIRKLSLDSILSERPELYHEAHVSGHAPRSLGRNRTGVLSGVCSRKRG